MNHFSRAIGTPWRSWWLPAVSSALLTAPWIAPPRVLAESAPPPCGVGIVWPRSGDIPADQPAFVVPTYGDYGVRDDAVLELWATLGDVEPVLVPSTTRAVSSPIHGDLHVVEPTGALPLGASLELRGNACSSYPSLGEVSVVYRVVDDTAAPPAPPLSLQTRVVGYASEGELVGVFAEATMVVEGGGELAAWSPFVTASVGIGDERPGVYVTGREVDTLARLTCEGFVGLAPGPHAVAGRLVTLDSEVLGALDETVRFDCEDARYFTYDGAELTPEQVARLRRPGDPGADAGVARTDASIAMDAGPDEAVSDGGCAAGGARPGLLGASTLGLMLVLRRRRR